MDLENPHSLAAELRARARLAAGEEQHDLLYLADEYERLGDAHSCDVAKQSIKVFLPK